MVSRGLSSWSGNRVNMGHKLEVIVLHSQMCYDRDFFRCEKPYAIGFLEVYEFGYLVPLCLSKVKLGLCFFHILHLLHILPHKDCIVIPYTAQ